VAGPAEKAGRAANLREVCNERWLRIERTW